jgi:hypothetical protein
MQGILPVAEQNDIKTQSKEMTEQISVLVKEQSELQGARKVHGQLLKARKQKLAIKKKIGGRVVCQSTTHSNRSYERTVSTERLIMVAI